MIAAEVPESIESFPRPGPIVFSSNISKGAGRAPALNNIERLLASSTVKPPSICPEPPKIGVRITGAEITSLSKIIAKGLPTFSDVAFAKYFPPSESNLKFTIGAFVAWSKLA